MIEKKQPPTAPALPTPQDYLTSRELGLQYRLSTAYLSMMRCRGEGPRFMRLGAKKVLYLRADVESWIQSHAVETVKAS
ncbi:MAG: hypothetical protein Q8O19_04740 [Rectinemataceae bacterium]|nr:hypothetical protein [Rectinemataceae bacterium]